MLSLFRYNVLVGRWYKKNQREQENKHYSKLCTRASLTSGLNTMWIHICRDRSGPSRIHRDPTLRTCNDHFTDLIPAHHHQLPSIGSHLVKNDASSARRRLFAHTYAVCPCGHPIWMFDQECSTPLVLRLARPPLKRRLGSVNDRKVWKQGTSQGLTSGAQGSGRWPSATFPVRCRE
jgi:hypothetical protein